MKAEWIDRPDKVGKWWMSPFINNEYLTPSLKEVVDYGKSKGELVVNSGIFSTSVERFCTEYYPKSKWLFIPEPDIHNLVETKGIPENIKYCCPKCHVLSEIEYPEEIIYSRSGDCGGYLVKAINLTCPICKDEQRIEVFFFTSKQAAIERLNNKNIPEWWG